MARSIKTKIYRLSLALLLCLSAASPISHAAPGDIVVLGLFKGAALLKVDGEQKLLKVGQTWKGIALLEATSKQGLADINGERQTLTMSKHITSNYTQPEKRSVSIRKNLNLQYITNAKINGRGTQVLVDTGANSIALSSASANALGVKYREGIPAQVTTASGVTNAYQITLNSVDVGGIRVDRVRATVIEGNFPEMPLLGTTFLQHVEMHEKDGVLMLMSKF
jgi:aspartyl protease family protein